MIIASAMVWRILRCVALCLLVWTSVSYSQWFSRAKLLGHHGKLNFNLLSPQAPGGNGKLSWIHGLTQFLQRKIWTYVSQQVNWLIIKLLQKWRTLWMWIFVSLSFITSFKREYVLVMALGWVYFFFWG